MTQLTSEQNTASTEPDVPKDSLDVLHDDIEDLKQRVDAIFVAAICSR